MKIGIRGKQERINLGENRGNWERTRIIWRGKQKDPSWSEKSQTQ